MDDLRLSDPDDVRDLLEDDSEEDELWWGGSADDYDYYDRT